MSIIKNINCSLPCCIKFLNAGNIIAYPTECLFGLGCDPNNDNAILNLLYLKKRKIYKGLILIAAHYRYFLPYINTNKLSYLHIKTMLLAWKSDFITFLVPSNANVSKLITGSSEYIAIRVTRYPILKKLCTYYGRPIISTSANISGMQATRTSKSVLEFFGTKVAILDGSVGNFSYPSKIFNIITGEYIRYG